MVRAQTNDILPFLAADHILFRVFGLKVLKYYCSSCFMLSNERDVKNLMHTGKDLRNVSDGWV